MRAILLLQSALLVFLLVFAVSCCSTVGSEHLAHYIGPEIRVVAYTVAVGGNEDVLGVTCATWKPGCTVSLEIRSDILEDEKLAKRVVVHELIHASGLCGHPWNDPSYFLFPMGLPFLPEHLGDGERAWLQSHQVTITVHPTEPLRELCEWAISFLNAEVGRVMYRVER